MKITILDDTTKNPLQAIGQAAGVCWNANTADSTKNAKRALDCIASGHGRVEEWVTVNAIVECSAKCMREITRHHIGMSFLQASTRYIDYEKGFETVKPHSVQNNSEASILWDKTIDTIQKAMSLLKEYNIPKEDYSNLLPLAYVSKMVWKVNLRNLVNFMGLRLCSRAYWEIREFSKELIKALSDYSEEWRIICDTLFAPKCEQVGYCTEKQCCGRMPRKEEVIKEKDSND